MAGAGDSSGNALSGAGLLSTPAQQPPQRPARGGNTQTTNPPAGGYKYANQDLLDRTNSIIQESLRREYEAAQRALELQRLAAAQALNDVGSTSSSSSEGTDDENDPDEDWHRDQVALNVVLRARNEYSLMPSSWKHHLRGIPLPDNLFYSQTTNAATRPRPKIYALNERYEYRGTKILRKLMDVHGRVADLRDRQLDAREVIQKLPFERQVDENRIIGKIERRIEAVVREAIRWASLDGDLTRYAVNLSHNLTIIRLTEENQDGMREQIFVRLERMREAWERRLAQLPGPQDQRPEPPVLFACVIYRHILFIATMDASQPDAVEHIPIQMNMGENTQHQWNALAIMLTICWARDLIRAKITEMDLQPRSPAQPEVDPDA